VRQMERLKQALRRIDGKGYKAYKDIEGSYRGEGFALHIDHVQGDPFASPSRIRVELAAAVAGVEEDWLDPPWRRVAAEDFFARSVAQAIRGGRSTRGAGGGYAAGGAGYGAAGGHGTGKSGLIAIDAPGQQVLARTAVVIDRTRLEVRLSVGLPAAGRTILGLEAEQLLCGAVPHIVREGVLRADRDRLRRHLELADQQAAIRAWLREHGHVAFVADGSVLPRESGVSDRPMKGDGVVPFRSPERLAAEIPVPHRSKPIRGMVIPRGVTLIVGGGYHGKSTLLHALERGVYNHVEEDGREYVITEETAVKIRAEDGRRIECVDISPFISNLPFGKRTDRFSTDDASGSTSQAANIMEALEMGAGTLLIDEDTSATNFMIRDARMQRLVAKSKEPITPFVDKVRQLYEQHGVSTVLVVGGSGDYFKVADTVIMMDEYMPVDVTEEARRIAAEHDSGRTEEVGEAFGPVTPRIIHPDSFDASRGRREKVDAKGLATILYGTQAIDLSQVEQLVDPSQTRAIALMMQELAKQMDKRPGPEKQLQKQMPKHAGEGGELTLSEQIGRLYEKIAAHGLDILSQYRGKHPGDLALPRKFELAAAVNRLRTLRARPAGRQKR